MSNKYTDAECERVMREARELLARGTEPYTPPPEPPRRRFYDSGPPAPEPRRERRLTDAQVRRMADAAAATPQPEDWKAWVDTRIAAALEADREVLLPAVSQIVGDNLGTILGNSIEHERQRYEREIGELRREAAKLNSAVEALHGLLSAERSKTP